MHTMTTPQLPPPGWYPTDKKGGVRYWDGHQWGAFWRAERPSTVARAGALLFTLSLLLVILVWVAVNR